MIPGRDAIGIDLGGTNLRAALFRGLADGQLAPLAERRTEVGEPRDPATMVSRIAGLVAELGAEPSTPIGIGFAGMFRGHDGLVVRAPYLRWQEEVPLGALLAQRFGADRPIWLGNDVNAICYGEHAVGAARGGCDVLAVFVGTGIGGGIVVNGALVEAASNCAAEIGHVKVAFDERARPCACGSLGCIEAYAGGDNIARRARAELRGGARSLVVELAGGSPDAVHAGHLDEAAGRGDPYAQELWSEIAPLLGATVANAVTLLNPSHVVLGGGVLSRTPILREYVEAAFWVAVNPPNGAAVTLLDAALGDHAGMIGAALLALRK